MSSADAGKNTLQSPSGRKIAFMSSFGKEKLTCTSVPRRGKKNSFYEFRWQGKTGVYGRRPTRNEK
jgi:hypothetical protein